MKATNTFPKLIQIFLGCGVIAVALTSAMALQELGRIRAMEYDIESSEQTKSTEVSTVAESIEPQ
ncbi:MAG: hypothetical protein AAFQ98_06935 [Bacteroidota bacterium]